jgi:hypothetical protein
MGSAAVDTSDMKKLPGVMGMWGDPNKGIDRQRSALSGGGARALRDEVPAG